MKMNLTFAVEESYNNSTYLREEQYQSADNLNARIEIHRRFSTAKKEWNDFIFEHIPPFSQANFKGLALGCGNATQWRENQSRFPRNMRMVLSEFSYGMLQEPDLPLRKMSDSDFARWMPSTSALRRIVLILSVQIICCTMFPTSRWHCQKSGAC